MKPNWKTPTILAAALLALFIVAYWVEFKGKPASEEREAASRRIFALKDEDPIKSITLALGVRPIGIECFDKCKNGESGQWKVTAPESGEADNANCGTVATSVRTFASGEVVDLSTESEAKRKELLGQYGLAEDQLKTTKRVEVVTASGKKQVAYFGTSHPMGDRFYVAVEVDGKLKTDTVYLAAAYQKGSFDRDPSYFRNRRLTSLAATDVVKLQLASSKGRFELEKDGANWTLKDGGNVSPAESEAVDGLLSQLTMVSAKAFAASKKDSPEAKKALTGSKQTVTVTLGLKDKKSVILAFFDGAGKKPAQKFFATVSNAEPLYEMDLGVASRFEKSRDDLRVSKLLTPIEQFSVTQATVRGKKLVRKEGKWQLEGKEVDQNKMQKLLSTLSTSKLKGFVAKLPSGEAQGVRIVLGDESTPEKKHFVFWKSGKDIFARDLKNKRPEAMQLDAALGDVLPWTDQFFDVAPTLPAPGAKK